MFNSALQAENSQRLPGSETLQIAPKRQRDKIIIIIKFSFHAELQKLSRLILSLIVLKESLSCLE